MKCLERHGRCFHFAAIEVNLAINERIGDLGVGGKRMGGVDREIGVLTGLDRTDAMLDCEDALLG